MKQFLLIVAGFSLSSLAKAGTSEQFILDTCSPDGHYALIWRPAAESSDGHVLLFDCTIGKPLGADLSTTDVVLRLLGTAHKMRLETPQAYQPSYHVAWSEGADMVAIHAGFHQFSSVSLFRRNQQGLQSLSLPSVASFRSTIESDIAPFRLSKLWSSHPSWLDARRLKFDVTGDAFRQPAQREADFLHFTYGLVIRVHREWAVEVESLQRENPQPGDRGEPPQ